MSDDADRDRPADSDWGLPDGKSGMSREMKVGLVLILLLAGAFGYVVYRKMQNANEFPDIDGAATTRDRSERRKRTVEPLAPTPDGGATTADTDRRSRRRERKNGVATTTAQNEPPFGGSPDATTSGVPGGNPFQQTSASTAKNGSATTSDHSSGKVRVNGFPSGQSDPNAGGNPFAAQNGASGSATTVDTGAKSASPWDLSGNGKATTTATPKDGSATTGDNPFGGSATTVDHGKPAGDAFRSADAGRRGTPVFQKTIDTGAFNGRRRRHASRRADVNAGTDQPQGVFGGNFEKSGSATTVDNGSTPRDGSATTRDDGRGGLQPVPTGNDRLGPYRFAADRRRRAGSTTTVQTGGLDDEPFGKSADTSLRNGSATTVDHGTTVTAQPGSGVPATLDGQDIQYGNDRPRVHIVGYGDNYWTISRTAYGTSRYFQVLAEYNRHRIPDPKRLKPGMKVLVPTIEILATRFPKLCPARRTSQGFSKNPGMSAGQEGFFRDRTGAPLFRVGKTDTLSEIAQRHLGRSSRWIQIYHLNRERIPNPNRLTIGTELRLPADASSIRVVRRGGEFR